MKNIHPYQEVAEAYLKRFSWGLNFITINKEVLDIYANCKDGQDVVDKQNQYLQSLKELKERAKDEIDLPPSYSDYSDEEEEGEEDTVDEQQDKSDERLDKKENLEEDIRLGKRKE